MPCQVRNSVDMFPDYDRAGKSGCGQQQGPKPGSFPPLAARLQCEQWLRLRNLVHLDFSCSDDITISNLHWGTLFALRTLRLNNIKRLVGFW